MKTPKDLKIAYEIVGSSSTTDQYGTPLWSESDIFLAKETIAWFKSFFNKARRMTGAWCDRIKLLWQEIKENLYKAKIKPHILRVKIDVFYKILFRNGVYITLDKTNPLNTLLSSRYGALNQLIKIINN